MELRVKGTFVMQLKRATALSWVRDGNFSVVIRSVSVLQC